MEDIIFKDLGQIGFQKAWDYQETLLQKNIEIKTRFRNEGASADEEQPATRHYLLFCEHLPVYTLGKSGDISNLLYSEKQLAERGIQFVKTNRGGDITFHGPEQIVGYPILDLEKFFTDIGRYLRSLEEVIIKTIAEYGIKGNRSPGETGVWIEPDNKAKARKICAMGVRCSRWVTMHGFALNVNTPLDYFSGIIPCGIADKQVTSIEKEIGRKVPLAEVEALIKTYFEEVFEAKIIGESNNS